MARKYKAPPRKRTPPEPKFTTMTLRCRHSINGIVYGPGVGVKVPTQTAHALAHAEGLAVQADADFQNTKAVIIDARSAVPRAVHVDPATFMDSLNRLMI